MTRLTLGCISLLAIWLILTGFSVAKINPDDIIGMWTFDEGKGDKAEDTSGKKNNGDIVGPKWVDGKFGKCLEFDGKDDYVNCGNDVSLDPPHITMIMWVWFDHIPYVHDIALNKEGKYRLIGGEVDNTHVSVRYATKNTAWGPGTVAGKTLLEAKRWYHAAGSYDGEKWRIFLDGKLDGDKKETGDLVSNANNVYIGMYQPPNGWPFTGYIDEVVLLKVGLKDEADIQELMNKGTAVLSKGKLAQTWGKLKQGH